MAHIIHIVAYDKAGVIGIKDKLPFTLPEDLASFKMLTDGSLICMGFNTYASIVKNYMAGKTEFLPGRKVAVACSDDAKAKARNMANTYDNVTFFSEESLRQLVSRNREAVIVVGGNSLYKRFNPSLIIATEVESDVPAGTPIEDIFTYPVFNSLKDYKRLVTQEGTSSNGLKFKRVLYVN